MEYELFRSKRKTIAIYVRDGRVIVRAPMRVPAREIDSFVISKSAWIEKHLASQAQRTVFKPDYGSVILFLGGEYRIESYRGDNTLYMPPGLNHDRIQKNLVRFYRDHARAHIEERVGYYSKLMNVKPSGVRIGSAKKSWGSCTSKGRLTFSWRLMMAPPEAIDYVVVHELAHLKQLNHSKKFWAIVSDIIPDWKDRRNELRLLQKRLSNEVWD